MYLYVKYLMLYILVQVAVATLVGNITIFDVKSATQVNTIEGRSDLGSGRLETDIVTAKKNAQSKWVKIT